VPLLAGADGGSGSFSMYEKRNASGQLVNVLIELGDSDRGIGNAVGDGAEGIVSMVMRRPYNWAETVSGTAGEPRDQAGWRVTADAFSRGWRSRRCARPAPSRGRGTRRRGCLPC
jgi:hypothetical protein